MNKKQISYQTSRFLLKNLGFLYFLSSSALVYDSIRGFLFSINNKNLFGTGFAVAEGVFAAYLGREWLKNSIFKRFLNQRTRRINKYKKIFPLQHEEKIIIEDKNGLEALLEKTAEEKGKEWGTVLKSKDDNHRAIVYDIVSPEETKKNNFILKQKKFSTTWNARKILNSGYNGIHHYHPHVGPKWYGANFFAVSVYDRAIPFETNLLTFNMPEGPEIIGYNFQHIYIPSGHSRKDKKELIKAAPAQIMEYLK